MSLEQSIPHRGCLLKSHGHDPGLPVLTVRERKTKLTFLFSLECVCTKDDIIRFGSN